MSRIHEALKKAAEERSAQLSPGKGADLVDVEIGIRPTTEIPPRLPEMKNGSVASTEKPRNLCFEELIKSCPHPVWRPSPQASVFPNTVDGRHGAENFRTLRSRLYQIAKAQNLQRVLITSSIQEEGKSFVTANLAQSIARQPDKRVLLIDADLRASRLHYMLGAPKTPGLTDYLRGEADEFAIIQAGPDANFCFIPAGNDVSEPSELLLNERMKKLLDLITPMFDWVILDSPPALPVHDASILADVCDGVLFVVRAGATKVEMAEKAVSEFRQKNLLGVVLNRVEKDASYGNYYYGPRPEGE